MPKRAGTRHTCHPADDFKLLRREAELQEGVTAREMLPAAAVVAAGRDGQAARGGGSLPGEPPAAAQREIGSGAAQVLAKRDPLAAVCT